MQTPKAKARTTTSSSPTPQKRVVRYSDHTASSSLASRASPKAVKSPNSPNPEKRRTSNRVSELEGQISQLENDLKIVKDQLCSTEALKKQAQKDVEESNQHLADLSLKLQESQKQLEKTTDKRDQRLHSEIEAIREKSSSDSAALVSALDEIKQLKAQLEMVAESKATKSESEQQEFRKLKDNLSGTLLIVEDMKKELNNSQELEAQAQALVGETLMQLESAKKMVETLRSDGLKTMDDYNAVALELQQSKARVVSLEELVKKLNADISKNEERRSLESVETEVEELRSALMAAEMRQSRSGEEMRNAIELVEKIKSASDEREGELETEIQRSKFAIEELKANLMDKETELQGICEENEGLNAKLESSLSGHRGNELEKKLNELNTEIENLKGSLMEKETEMEKTSKENEKLKMEIESARAAEREAVMKVGYMMEEVDKSNRRAERVGEQLVAVQAANAEMERELRKLKVQSEQWRKAAEAAAAMLNNGQVMERTGSMDSHYSPRMGKISSPYGERDGDGDDVDEDLLKKKNANVLKRFGVLWKKPQK